MIKSLPAIVVAVGTVLAAVVVARSDTDAEVTRTFGQFIAAQNAHNAQAVGDILLDSPDFFWLSRGTPVWGRTAALARFRESYKGTWLLEPKFDEMKVTELGPGVARLYVPAVFTIAPPGQPALPRPFLMTQIYVKTGNGWKLSTILPVPAPAP
jgi:hypothetical protein